MILKDNKHILNGVLIFSILSLSIAYFIQYVLGHKPCNLCLIERIPYIASVILISLIFILNKFEKIISIIILLFFIFGAIVSFYHFGIEWRTSNLSVGSVSRQSNLRRKSFHSLKLCRYLQAWPTKSSRTRYLMCARFIFSQSILYKSLLTRLFIHNFSSSTPHVVWYR